MITHTVNRIRFTTVLALLLAGIAAAQGSPSGEYGTVSIGQPVSGSIAGIQGEERVVFHTYVVSVPQGTLRLTIAVDGGGADLDLSVKLGTPIIDYDDVDHLDVSEEHNPVYSIDDPQPSLVYIDVMNLLPSAANYQLTVSADTATTGGNPLGAGQENPFAPTSPADPFVGSFEGDGLGVTVTGANGQYQGELDLNGQILPFSATANGPVMEGSFQSGGSSFPFYATLQGNTLVVESGGGVYNALRRLTPAAIPDAPVAPDNPLGGTPTNDPVMAQGAYGTLTQDNAAAFIEALEFSLQQVGYVASFSESDRVQLFQTLQQNYPFGTPVRCGTGCRPTG